MEAKITRELAARFRAGRCLCDWGKIDRKELKEDAGMVFQISLFINLIQKVLVVIAAWF